MDRFEWGWDTWVPWLAIGGGAAVVAGTVGLMFGMNAVDALSLVLAILLLSAFPLCVGVVLVFSGEPRSRTWASLTILFVAAATLVFIVLLLSHDSADPPYGIRALGSRVILTALGLTFVAALLARRELLLPRRSLDGARVEEKTPSLLISAIYVAVGAVTLLVWTILGLVFWIPLLVRTTMLFVAAVLHDSLTGGSDMIANAQRGLDLAVSFYVGGFVRIAETIRRRGVAQFGKLEPHPIALGRLALEMLWAITVWAATLWSLAGFPAFWMSGSLAR